MVSTVGTINDAIPDDCRRRLIQAPLVVDAAGRRASPGAILLDEKGIIAAGPVRSIGIPSGTALQRRPDVVLLPALVNAHCHLDLSGIGPLAYPGSFVGFIEEVRRLRASEESSIAQGVRRGIELARAGGTAMVGDIAGWVSRSTWTVPINELRSAGMPGVSYLEVFGIGRRQADAIGVLREAAAVIPRTCGGVRLGLSPHALYSCGPRVYSAAASLGLPVATHLAETLGELELTQCATGPLVGLLKRLGLWDDPAIEFDRGHPVDLVVEAMGGGPFLGAHLNYLDPRHIHILAGCGSSVVYCPRASRYFGHPHNGHPSHRYRQMLGAGVNVALGTDSLLCLDTPRRISVLDEMRYLFGRDGTSPLSLLRMATVAGAVALGFDPALVTFEPGPTAGVLAVRFDPARGDDPLRQILTRSEPPQWVAGPLPSAAALAKNT